MYIVYAKLRLFLRRKALVELFTLNTKCGIYLENPSLAIFKYNRHFSVIPEHHLKNSPEVDPSKSYFIFILTGK